ncbi:MAG: tRNA (guanosine(37)-N1)-methyltransferase TrmD [Alphaproteobacteria bacterium]|nr:tRNA (guanosine(37)-N1)-methyltransferase TrmD [Alphaproteobacteria bacterium]
MSWRATVLTLFPEVFPGVLDASLPGKARKEGLWMLETLDIRSFARDKHASVDDTPYGGGAGMVLRPDVMDDALAGAEASFGPHARRLYLSPRGRLFDQALAKELAGEPSVLFVCGRYEGLDQRVIDARGLEEVSIGDFVLAGGEIAAMAVIEACVRLIPGVLGNEATVDEESFSEGLLEYPHYTRPAEWKGVRVPEVLLSGNHEKIRGWRREQAEEITQKRRPDLYETYVLTKKETKGRVS